MMYYGYYNMMNWGGLSWIIMILFWGLVIFGIIALISHGMRRKMHDGCMHDKDIKTPLEILKERYAKGDIDKKQYEEMKKDLG